MTLTDRPSTEPTVTTKVPTRRSLSQVVGGGVLTLIGLLWLLERSGAIDVSVTAVLALGTVIIGISLMLLARDGPHIGLAVLGTLLALVTLLTAAAPFEGFQGGIGNRTFEVSSVDDIRPDYNQALGQLTLDLRGIENLNAPTRVTASVGMGELVVRIPEGTLIQVDAAVGASQIEILGRMIDGVDIEETYESPGLAESSKHLSLELQAFTGRVEVTDE